jgi:hypothetical protein
MKKLVIIAIAIVILFSSCAPKLMSVERRVYPYVMDLRQYSQEGFFVSPTDYIGLFEPIADITMEVFPSEKDEIVKVYITWKGDIPYSEELERKYGKPQEIKKRIKERISSEELLKIIVDYAKNMGADALVNVKIHRETYTYTTPAMGRPETEILWYECHGFAIKRK